MENTQMTPAAGSVAKPSWLGRLGAPLQELLHPPRGQNPALDVLRTFAILMVVAAHTLTPTKEAGMPETLFTRFPLVRGGWTGVDLFFVLSGYLIGRQLWRELQKTSSVDIRKFMIRRGLRIWPLYYAALAFTLLVLEPGRFGFADWWPDAAFLANYMGPKVVHGGWSLCIEEQFYLLAPLLLALGMPLLRSVASFRRVLIALFLVLPAVRALMWWHLTAHHPDPDQAAIVGTLYYPFHTHSDGLVIGLLLSNLEATQSLVAGRGLLGKGWVVVVGFGLCGLCYLTSARFLNYTGLGLAFGSLVCYCLPRTGALPAFFAARPFYVLSRLSYGMYLNHQWVTWPIFRALHFDGAPWDVHPLAFNVVYFVLMALCSTAAACVTFALIEWPFLRLRDRVLHGQAPRTSQELAVSH